MVAIGCADQREPELTPAPVIAAPTTAPLPLARPIAIVDVAVVSMEAPGVLAHQTVVVDGDAIVAIGPADRVVVPQGATRIDGRGKTVLPGLADMHVHLDGTRAMLAQFLAAGVTTVRNMAGSPRTVALRERIARGQLFGPRVYTAGPIIDGEHPRWEYSEVVKTHEDAARVTSAHATAGYDFVKVYNGLSLAAYDALAQAAAARHLRLVGHVPFAVPLAHALATQASIEHLTGYAVAIERDDSPERRRKGDPSVIRRWMFADDDKISRVAAATARAGVWNCPTLVTSVAYGELWRGKIPQTDDLDAESPDWRARWDPKHLPRRPDRGVRKAMESAHDGTLRTQLALVRELAVAGAPLIAGTDTPNPYVVPGESLHHELALFVDAGLSPYAALRAATIDAAAFLGDARAGRIALGAHADLVVVTGDPLADIHAIDKIEGVMTRGAWWSRDQLAALRDERINAYRDPPWHAAIDLDDVAPGARVTQYVVADNTAPVGAYAVARVGDAVIERQTLEDETWTVRTTSVPGHRARTLVVDVDRPEGPQHAEFDSRDVPLLGALTPVSARELVEHLALDEGGKLELAVEAPDPDVPSKLVRGHVAITRTPTTSGHDEERNYQIVLTFEHGLWVARITVDGTGLPRSFRLSSTTRPVVRSWKIRKAPPPAPPAP